jgi:hypothetical protein
MLFDREAIEAGNSVLKHWEKVINNPAEQTGLNHCPYCKIYVGIYNGDNSEMKKLLDEIFIKSLLLFDIREDFYEK